MNDIRKRESHIDTHLLSRALKRTIRLNIDTNKFHFHIMEIWDICCVCMCVCGCDAFRVERMWISSESHTRNDIVRTNGRATIRLCALIKTWIMPSKSIVHVVCGLWIWHRFAWNMHDERHHHSAKGGKLSIRKCSFSAGGRVTSKNRVVLWRDVNI